MVHQVNQFRKAGGAYVTHDELAEILAPLLANWEALEAVSTEHDEKIQRIEGALEIQDAEIGEAHPAESDPEGIELVEKIHERKSGKRKPEGVDPLGLVPDPQGE
jgi:hypothetical protein